MILAFQLSDLITIPFGYLLGWLYQLTSSYGLALILFAILVKLVLMPASAKGKKSTMKMSRLTPQMNLIREKYANDQQKMNMAIQELYKKEGVSMTGGVGSITGTLAGVFVICLLKTGLPFIGLTANWQQIITGIVLIISVLIDILKREKEAK